MADGRGFEPQVETFSIPIAALSQMSAPMLGDRAIYKPPTVEPNRHLSHQYAHARARGVYAQCLRLGCTTANLLPSRLLYNSFV